MKSTTLKSIIESEFYIGASEMTQRFQNLRGSNLLPNEKGQASRDLTDDEITNAILSVMDNRPGYSALVARCTKSLKPVRGKNYSYREANTFGEAIASAFCYPEEIVEIKVKGIENDDKGIPPYARGGRAQVLYKNNKGKENIAYYVPATALSLFNPNSEGAINYNPKEFRASYEREYVLGSNVFRRVHAVLKQEREHRAMLEKFG